jgi:hypothetical protein
VEGYAVGRKKMHQKGVEERIRDDEKREIEMDSVMTSI